MDAFMNEIDILCMECTNDVENILNSSAICYLEAGEDKKGSALKKVIDRIKDMIKKAIEKIQSLFNKKTAEDTQKKINEAIKNDPSLKSKKIKVKSNEKLIKLNKDTSEKVKKCKNKKELEDTMEKYRKQRNVLMGGVIIAVPVIGFCTYMLSKKNNDINELNKYNKELSTYNKDLEKAQSEIDDHINKLKYENSKLRTKNKALGSENVSLKHVNQDLRRNMSTDQETLLKELRLTESDRDVQDNTISKLRYEISELNYNHSNETKALKERTKILEDRIMCQNEIIRNSINDISIDMKSAITTDLI